MIKIFSIKRDDFLHEAYYRKCWGEFGRICWFWKQSKERNFSWTSKDFLEQFIVLTPWLAAWPLRGQTALKSILWETLFLDQLHDFSLLSLNSISHPFLKSKFMKKKSLITKKFHFRSSIIWKNNIWPRQRGS